MVPHPHTLARWYVAPGQEAAFVAAWNELAAFFLSLPEPPSWGTLLRSIEEPRLFYSFGPWPNLDAIAAMRAHPDASRTMARLTALCETVELGTFRVETTAGQLPVA